MRMRLAMRLSEVDAAKAKTEFEVAVTGSDFISSADKYRLLLKVNSSLFR